MFNNQSGGGGSGSGGKASLVMKDTTKNTPFIKYYEKSYTENSSAEAIKSKFHENTKKRIREKAKNGHSNYITYLELNPSLERPDVYDGIYLNLRSC